MNTSVKFFRCALPTDAAAADVIRHFQEQGLVCADHALRRKDRIVTVLTEAEIALLKDAGIAVEVGAPLANGKPPPDKPPPNALVDDLTTGFVSTYLDTPGIHAAYAALNAAFPALTQLSDLPELTNGYEGAGLPGRRRSSCFASPPPRPSFPSRRCSSSPACMRANGLRPSPPSSSRRNCSTITRPAPPIRRSSHSTRSSTASTSCSSAPEIPTASTTRAMTRRCGGRTAVPTRHRPAAAPT